MGQDVTGADSTTYATRRCCGRSRSISTRSKGYGHEAYRRYRAGVGDRACLRNRSPGEVQASPVELQSGRCPPSRSRRPAFPRADRSPPWADRLRAGLALRRDGQGKTNAVFVVSVLFLVSVLFSLRRLRRPPSSSSSPSSSSPSGSSSTSPGTSASPARSRPPVNAAPPTISGSATQGSTLTASTGTWTNTPTSYAYRWQRCNTGGCQNIGGATGATYLLGAADVGSTVRVSVTARNAAGSGSATSARTGTVSGPIVPPPPPTPPVNTAPPTISGSATEGGTLSASTGTWTNTPTSYGYQWQRCNTGACQNVGAPTSTYLLGSSDVGRPFASP